MGIRALTVTSLVFSLLLGALAEQCGKNASGTLCPNDLCCSKYGYCGTTDDYCCDGCQSQCNCGGGGGGDCGGGGDDDDGDNDGDGYLGDVISKSTFEKMLMHRSDPPCPGGFYTYKAFIEAAKAFPDFATQGDDETRKREIAAFFGQTSHETTGGWPKAPDGPYAWGYCFVEEINCPSDYCDKTNLRYPCAPGKRYCGRGPIQLTWNYNYGQCGEAPEVEFDLLNKPDCVKKDPVLSFKTAIWFWMTPQAPKPSCHDVITGVWKPSDQDLSAGRVPGYGVLTNIINGGLECGIGEDTRVDDRIGFYKRYCDMLGIDYGDNLDCSKQTPFGSGLLVNTI